MTLEQFVQHLTASGLMSATEVIAFQDSLPPPKPRDAETLARELVQASRLTRYQAAAVYHGKAKGLVFGEYRALDKLGQGGMGNPRFYCRSAFRNKTWPTNHNRHHGFRVVAGR